MSFENQASADTSWEEYLDLKFAKRITQWNENTTLQDLQMLDHAICRVQLNEVTDRNMPWIELFKLFSTAAKEILHTIPNGNMKRN